MSLHDLRKHIDALDEKITGLLNQRAQLSVDIAGLKQKTGMGIYAPEREREVLQKVKRHSTGPLNAKALEAIYREIMSASLALEKPLKIAYLGPEATFTHLAALKRFGSQLQYLACKSIGDVFTEVRRGGADYGVVPVENSVEGAVTHTLDMLVDSDLKICAQVILDISHNLLASGPIEKIKKVYSISQIFGQCRIWIQQHMPAVELIEVSSSTRAAQIAASEKNSAAIASLLAASVYKLKVLARGIEDSPHNITRFFVISQKDTAPSGHDKTSIIFSIKDRVGALYDMLVPFKKHGINLTKIESRPSKKKAWDYYFFVDFLGHQQDSRVKEALSELEDKCTFFKILGSYPMSE